jgi:hypothetical protein
MQDPPECASVDCIDNPVKKEEKAATIRVRKERIESIEYDFIG